MTGATDMRSKEISELVKQVIVIMKKTTDETKIILDQDDQKKERVHPPKQTT